MNISKVGEHNNLKIKETKIIEVQLLIQNN